MFTIIGLGNPDKEYENTRHNTGRIALDAFQKKFDFEEWKYDKKLKALVSIGNIDFSKEKQNKKRIKKITLVKPETYMNKSGNSVKQIINNPKKTTGLVVIYDDLDLPLGKIKIAFNRGSGGHNGLESIIRALKTKSFIRIRIGISLVTPKGKTKKPIGEKKVIDFILGNFSISEKKILNVSIQKACLAIQTIIFDGVEKAMGEFNK